MRSLSVVLLVIIAVTIVVIAALIRPDLLSDSSFWLDIGWILILAGLNWGTSTYMLFTIGEGKQDTIFGAVPSISIGVFIYSLVSLALLFVSWYVSAFAASNWHLITQVSAFSITAIICVLMLVAARAADIHGSEGVPSKEVLIQCIASLHDGMPETKTVVLKELKELDEIIRYSMPNVARLRSKENYKKLYSEISAKSMSRLSQDDILRKIQSLKALAKSC